MLVHETILLVIFSNKGEQFARLSFVAIKGTPKKFAGKIPNWKPKVEKMEATCTGGTFAKKHMLLDALSCSPEKEVNKLRHSFKILIKQRSPWQNNIRSSVKQRWVRCSCFVF